MLLPLTIITNLICFEASTEYAFENIDFDARGVFNLRSIDVEIAKKFYIKRFYIKPGIFYGDGNFDGFSGNHAGVITSITHTLYPPTIFFNGYEINFCFGYMKGFYGGLRRIDFIKKSFEVDFSVMHLIKRDSVFRFGAGAIDNEHQIVNLEDFNEWIVDESGNKKQVLRNSGFSYSGKLESFLFKLGFKHRYINFDFVFFPGSFMVFKTGLEF